MAFHPTAALQPRAATYVELARVVLVIGTIVALMLVLTAVFGWHQLGPSYQIVPDPAGQVGLPF